MYAGSLTMPTADDRRRLFQFEGEVEKKARVWITRDEYDEIGPTSAHRALGGF